MWICFNDAFVSVVQSKHDRDTFVVRARNGDHLRTLFPKKHVIKTEDSDYRFRVLASREEVMLVVSSRLDAIDYTNFKDSVKDEPLHDLYLDFWTQHMRYQNGAYDQKVKRRSAPLFRPAPASETIPVYAQSPNKPHKEVYLGDVPRDATAEEVLRCVTVDRNKVIQVKRPTRAGQDRYQIVVRE